MPTAPTDTPPGGLETIELLYRPEQLAELQYAAEASRCKSLDEFFTKATSLFVVLCTVQRLGGAVQVKCSPVAEWQPLDPMNLGNDNL